MADGRIHDPPPTAAPSFQHYKVVKPPIQNPGELQISQFGAVNTVALALEAVVARRSGELQGTAAITADSAYAPRFLNGNVPTVKCKNGHEACSTALHSIHLHDGWRSHNPQPGWSKRYRARGLRSRRFQRCVRHCSGTSTVRGWANSRFIDH